MEEDSRGKETAQSGAGAVMHWVDCKNELPEDVRRVLAIMSSGLVSVCYRWKGEWYMNDRGDTVEQWGYEVTHWMQLPPPPCA